MYNVHACRITTKERKPAKTVAVISEKGKGNTSVSGVTRRGVVKTIKTKKSKESGEYSDDEEEESW